jgi:nitrogen fixation protein FixH
MPALTALPTRTRFLRAVLALALLVATLAACGAAPATARQEQTVDGLTIGLEATESPQLNASERLVVTLADAQGQPVDGADVYVDMTMPTMPMGTNRPVAEGQGQGRYVASSAYTMTGEWELIVVAQVAGKEHRALFKITAVE